MECRGRAQHNPEARCAGCFVGFAQPPQAAEYRQQHEGEFYVMMIDDSDAVQELSQRRQCKAEQHERNPEHRESHQIGDTQ